MLSLSPLDLGISLSNCEIDRRRCCPPKSGIRRALLCQEEKKNFKEIGAKFDRQQGEFVVSRNEYKWYNLEYVLIFT